MQDFQQVYCSRGKIKLDIILQSDINVQDKHSYTT